MTWPFLAHRSVLLCIHEIGHGLTVKHYGAPVPAMGFLLIYLTPGFYTDTTAGEVKGDRFQRLMIAVAGVWSELVICALVTPIWWGTPPNTPIHDFAYTIFSSPESRLSSSTGIH